MVFLVRYTWRRSIQIFGVLKMLLWDWRSTEAQRSVMEVLLYLVVVVKPSPAACRWPRPDGVKVPVTQAKRKHSPGLSSSRQLHEDKCLWAALWTRGHHAVWVLLLSSHVELREQLKSVMLQIHLRLKLHPLCFYFNCREMHFNQG